MKNLRRDIAELRRNVYMCGHRDHGDWHFETTGAISEHAGREHSKEMQSLVKNKQESPPTEPREPKDDKNTFAVMKFKMQLNRHHDKLDKHNEHKAKVFVVVKGQCSLTMKNKIESMTECKDWEKNDDMTELLNGLKEVSFSTADVQ